MHTTTASASIMMCDRTIFIDYASGPQIRSGRIVGYSRLDANQPKVGSRQISFLDPSCRRVAAVTPIFQGYAPTMQMASLCCVNAMPALRTEETSLGRIIG